jgi:hypothetical protein
MAGRPAPIKRPSESRSKRRVLGGTSVRAARFGSLGALTGIGVGMDCAVTLLHHKYLISLILLF